MTWPISVSTVVITASASAAASAPAAARTSTSGSATAAAAAAASAAPDVVNFVHVLGKDFLYRVHQGVEEFRGALLLVVPSEIPVASLQERKRGCILHIFK